MKLRWGKPKKCVCVEFSKTFRFVPWWERELKGELFFAWLFVRGYIYW